jgi:peptidoglycan/LPS O-acetylase OafA/YrhL
MPHVKCLDGIRAIAVFLVMLFHFGYFPAGWVGVQIFFALSGYLITRILLERRATSLAAYAGQFYLRRALRILPLVCTFVFVVAVVYGLSGAPASLPNDWVALLTYTANFARLRDTDLGPCFVHLWSLALEAQFYLIWPFLLFFVPPRGLRWTVAGILVCTPVVRAALFQGLLASGNDAEYAGKALYVLPFTQLDAFAAGAAIPLWGMERMRHAGPMFLASAALAAVAGIGVLLKAHFVDGGAFALSFGYAMYLLESNGYVWGYSLLNLLSMLGLVCALQGIGPARALDNWLLVRIGKVSYGVYVYHLPLLLFGEVLLERLGIVPRGSAGWATFFAAWAGSVILVSVASFRWLEAPFLRLKRGASKRGDAQMLRQPAA